MKPPVNAAAKPKRSQSDVDRVAEAITETLVGSMRRNPDAWLWIFADMQDRAKKWRSRQTWPSKEPDKRIRALARAAIKAMQRCENEP